MSAPKVILDGLVFPECPRWNDGSLWFSDCHAGEVIRINPDGGILERFEVPGHPSGLGWLPDGQMLIGSIGDLCIYRRDADGEMHVHADLSPWHRFHSNDMVVDKMGNAYIGEVGFRMGKDEERTTSVVIARPDGSTEAAAEQLLTPNGSVISEDGKTFIVAESWARRLTALTIAADGTLGDRRLFAQFDSDDIPDGICLDAEDHVWVAAPMTNSVIRVSEKAGIVQRVTLPTENRPFACMLGGEDRRDLYVCCAPTHGARETRELRGGAIVKLRVDAPGTGCP